MYHGSQRDADALLSADVVLTTYGVCAAEFAAKKNSRLFTTQWRRIVLDEAHCIRNEGTAQAKAAMALRADGRWCLTGTPVHNSINDLLQLFQFIKLQPWYARALLGGWGLTSLRPPRPRARLRADAGTSRAFGSARLRSRTWRATRRP
jgi:hypothetical protein